MLTDPNTDVDQLVRIVSADQGLATRALRVANSSFYGRMRELESLKEAVMTIGLKNMHNIAMAHIAKDFTRGMRAHIFSRHY